MDAANLDEKLPVPPIDMDEANLDKKSTDNNSPIPPIEKVAANLDTKILSYIGGNGRKLKSRKIRKNNTSKKQNKTPRSK